MFTPATGCTNTYMYNMITGAQDMLDGKATELSGLKQLMITLLNYILITNLHHLLLT